jgi:protoporphyrinogen oxidase
VVEPVVVIGAGPAGISAGWQLAKRGIPVEVIEQDSVVGGLAKTISHRPGLRYDYGPHTFHIRETDASRRVVSAVQSLLNGQYRVLDRGTRLFLKGKFFVYPPEISEAMRKVSLGQGLRIGWDYMYAALRYTLNPAKQEDSFEDWGVRNLGRTLYDTFFGLYSEKVWGISMSQVSSRQAQRVAKLNLKNIILRMFKFKADPETYFIQYFYPCDGIGKLYQRMAEEVQASGGIVHVDAKATRIETDGQKVRAVTCEQAGKERVIPCQGLVSTLPLSAVAPMFAPVLSPMTLETAEKLDYCSLILVYLVVNRPRVTDYHWCYLIEPKFKCNRFSEQKNVSPDLLPEDKTVLCVEASCRHEDNLWRANDADLGRMAVNDLVQMGILRPENVEEHFVTRIRYAYPIYRLGFERVLYALLRELHQVQNFYTIGRHGLFMNNSMDDNVEMGMCVAEHIAEREARETWWQSVLQWTQLTGVTVS